MATPPGQTKEKRMSRRGTVLEFAVLGLLHEAPLHGYELRKRLTGVLGAFRVVSYGSLYPCLAKLSRKGLITESASFAPGGRRPRITYEITDEGRDVFADQLSRSGPASWDDDNFDVHFAFFSRASAEVRLRILEGRRLRLQERLERSREQARDSRSTRDSYIAELFRHDVESTEREVGWVNELIEIERKAVADPRPLSSEV
ncbi:MULTISPECIES: PadR family transcriptional regulator [Dermacoccus]|jgi:DNA-binding PadR family transcriptional regulator|nr:MULTISPECIES: PadR family transcriptional regulator [Dermacoccus]MCT1987155.1 PadR family transcriptional regulator [Dermacoccus abyssi]